MVEFLKDLPAAKSELILAKILIPSPTGSIPRPRLQTLLEQSLVSCTSTVLSGRAGTGKTVLARDFAENSGRDVAWYKVDAPDCELRIFFKYLIGSIRAQRSGFGKETLLTLLRNAEVEDITLFAEALVYELETVAAPLLIVIEDLHLVCDAEWLVPFFRRLLPLLPAQVHVLITSRTMPPNPLWRMRSKQTLSVIEEETLAFTRDEAVALFQRFGLSREQALIALDHSHGRASALSALAATLSFAESGVTGTTPFFGVQNSATTY